MKKIIALLFSIWFFQPVRSAVWAAQAEPKAGFMPIGRAAISRAIPPEQVEKGSDNLAIVALVCTGLAYLTVFFASLTLIGFGFAAVGLLTGVLALVSRSGRRKMALAAVWMTSIFWVAAIYLLKFFRFA